MLWPTRKPSSALPTGASTEILPESASASLGYTSVSVWCLPLDSSTQSADEFMLTTSCGIVAGSTMSARSNSSRRRAATGESRNAGASSRLSMRSTSSRERVIDVFFSMSVFRVGSFSNIPTARRFLNGAGFGGGQGGGIEQGRRKLLENRGKRQQESVHGRTLAPEHRDAAAGGVATKWRQVNIGRLRNRWLHRQQRQQRDAHVGRHHLAQGLETGRAEPVFFVGAGHPADLQRLVAQAMTVFQQQQMLVFQIRQLQQSASCQRVRIGRGQQERFLEQKFRVQGVVVHRQREDRGVQFAFAQPLHQLGCLLLDQQQFQPWETLADRTHHVRQQVRSQRGEDAQRERAGFRVRS